MAGGTSVRHADIEDAEAIGDLIEAMDVYYHGAGNTAGATAARDMARTTLTREEGTRFLLARSDSKPVGIACFSVLRPGVRLRGLIFLKDLFVLPQARGKGVGTALVQALAAHAVRMGIGRIDLTTGLDNAGAQRLYERLGGERQTVAMYRFDGKRLGELAGAPRQNDEAEA